MIPELGHFALILALCIAIIQTILPLLGAAWQLPQWMAVARPAAAGQLVFVTLAYICLTYAFVAHDFSVAYVAGHSNSELPLHYRLVSVWGGHEGSLLLWVLMLSLWSVAVAIFSHSLPQAVVARILAVMGFVSCGFLLFMIATSNPFDRLLPAPLDGRDLNPLLQDPGLIIHPPMLYMGYVGFSVAFAFAIAELLSGKLDSAWARWSRPWTLIAWVFLTLGITLGSWWAYYELGWGGWWFWDPVENASFMPWLIGTALIHSLVVTEKRGAFKSWTVLLAILAFSLSLLGTFLVRSGVLTSVHAFATDPERGIFILAFLGVVVGLSLSLYAWRAPSIGTGGHFKLVSRETFLLSNNILLAVACASVLLGTLFPLFSDVLGFGKLSVGPPYFDFMFTLLMAPLLVLLGIGPLARWKQDSIPALARQLWLLAVLAIVAASVPLVVIGLQAWIIVPGVAVAFWILLTSVQGIRERLKHKSNKWQAIRQIPMAFYGMTVAHIGVAVFVLGVTITNSFSIEKDVRLVPDQALTLGGHEFIFKGTSSHEGPNYMANRGTVEVFSNDTLIATLYPEKRIYRVQRMPMTEAAIDVGITRDLYVALGEPLANGAWSARVYYKPFIRWIWIGAVLMALGGILAASDKRYRRVGQSVKLGNKPNAVALAG